MKRLLFFRKDDFKKSLIILFIFSNLLILNTFYMIKASPTEIIDDNISFNNSILNLPQSYSNLLGIVNTLREGMIIKSTSLVNDSQNNCFFIGTISYNFGSESDILLGKLNSSNDIEWINILDFNLLDRGNDIILDVNQNSGFFLGDTSSSWSANSDCLISNFNLSNGDILWNTTFGFSLLSEEGYSIIKTNDLLFVTGIHTEEYQVYNTPDIFLACVNSTDQKLLWIDRYINSFYDCYPFLYYADIRNEIFLVYNRYEQTKLNYQFILQKINFDGNSSWAYTSESNKYPKINDLLLIGSDQLLLVGDCYEESSTSFRDNYIMYFNLTNEEITEKTYGKKLRNEVITSVDYSDFYELIICGYMESEINGNDIAFLGNIDSEGAEIWNRGFYEFYMSKLYDIAILSDKRIITLGQAAYDFDFFYRRLMICGNLDRDRDSLSDYWEPTIGTDPNKADTDNDGFSDAEEYFASTDPLNPRSYPTRRLSLRNFGLSIFILLIIAFVIIQIYIAFLKINDKKDKESKIKRFIRFIRKPNKKS